MRRRGLEDDRQVEDDARAQGIALDAYDSAAAARTFLKELPVPYPSYSDPDEEIARAIGGSAGFPATAFYDSDGRLAYTRQGQYASEADLATDIKRYAR